MRYALRVYLSKKPKTTTHVAPTLEGKSNEHEKPINLGTHTHEKSVKFPRFLIPQYWRGYQKIKYFVDNIVENLNVSLGVEE